MSVHDVSGGRFAVNRRFWALLGKLVIVFGGPFFDRN
jgi:hypothetical protein